jgi:hypothetical protein
MKKAIPSKHGGKRPGAGRPATGNNPMLSFRMPDPIMKEIRSWANANDVTRSEAVRQLVVLGLSASRSSRPHSAQTRAKAAALASETIDRHTDQSAAPEEQASRKRRLLKGPKEFREIRKDHK